MESFVSYKIFSQFQALPDKILIYSGAKKMKILS